jgi:phytoene dehydrogenase-like protein
MYVSRVALTIQQLSALRPRIRHPHSRNLYRVGASTRPGNGVPLVMIGAKLTADVVVKDMQELQR